MEKIVKRLRSGFNTLEELKLTRRDIQRLKSQGFNVKKKGKYYFIPQTEADNWIVFSEKTRNSVEMQMADIGDTHAGCKEFNERGLRFFFERAVKEGISMVHHSGDMVDGYGVYRGQLRNLTEWQAEDQVSRLADIFNDYPLEFVCIKGNHDISFEKMGGLAVGKILTQMCPKVRYIDDVVGDLVICGVLKRLVHGASGRAYARSYPSQVYIRELLNSDRGHRKIKGTLYRVQILQMGHYHTDMNFETAGISVIHPGNFQSPTEYTTRRGLVGPQGGRLTKIKAKQGEILEFESTFVKVK